TRAARVSQRAGGAGEPGDPEGHGKTPGAEMMGLRWTHEEGPPRPASATIALASSPHLPSIPRTARVLTSERAAAGRARNTRDEPWDGCRSAREQTDVAAEGVLPGSH